MASQFIEQGASAPTFDAAQWLADFTTLGGGYVHNGERIWLIDGGILAADLSVMVGQLAAKPERMTAVAAEIAARAGEVSA